MHAEVVYHYVCFKIWVVLHVFMIITFKVNNGWKYLVSLRGFHDSGLKDSVKSLLRISSRGAKISTF